MTIRPVEAELFYAEEQTKGRTDRQADRPIDRQTYMTKLYCFANAPEKQRFSKF